MPRRARQGSIRRTRKTPRRATSTSARAADRRQQTLSQTRHDERAAHERRRRADQLHDLDLVATRVDGESQARSPSPSTTTENTSDRTRRTRRRPAPGLQEAHADGRGTRRSKRTSSTPVEALSRPGSLPLDGRLRRTKNFRCQVDLERRRQRVGLELSACSLPQRLPPKDSRYRAAGPRPCLTYSTPRRPRSGTCSRSFDPAHGARPTVGSDSR